MTNREFSCRIDQIKFFFVLQVNVYTLSFTSMLYIKLCNSYWNRQCFI